MIHQYDFNPRPLRGGRLFLVNIPTSALVISIHAPCEGGDEAQARLKAFQGTFQSTPPARGATGRAASVARSFHISIHAPCEGGDDTRKNRKDDNEISIHAPCEGGDHHYRAKYTPIDHFNPRPLRGGRHFPFHLLCFILSFQSTPPARGATTVGLRHGTGARISIHAPCEGGDSKDAQFYLRIFDKQVELLRFLGKIRGGCLRNPEKDRRFLGKSLANLPEISGHLDFAGGGKAHPGYPCAVPLPRRAACVRGSGDPPADRCSSYRNAPLFSHIASLDSKSADCLSQNP